MKLWSVGDKLELGAMGNFLAVPFEGKGYAVPCLDSPPPPPPALSVPAIVFLRFQKRAESTSNHLCGVCGWPSPPARLPSSKYITPHPIHLLGLLLFLPRHLVEPGAALSEVLRALEMHHARDSLPSAPTKGSRGPIFHQENCRALP